MTKLISEKVFQLNPYQDEFVFSRAQFPAMISSWGTGKTLCAILRSKLYTDHIPGNLGLVCRREFVDLRDSTIKDFEEYTGIKLNSARDAIFKNGSVIMFRHIEELLNAANRKGDNNLQNINLGWFYIEQGEELQTDRAFWLLWGRLRRNVAPSPYFKSLGLPPRSGFVIGNVAGNNWIKRLWKVNPAKGFHLVEATTYDNTHNLPPDFIQNLETIKVKKPAVYNRFVMNDWTAEVESNVFHRPHACIAGNLTAPDHRFDYVAGLDLAKSHDYNVATVMNRQTRHMDGWYRWNRCSWNQTKERVKALNKKWGKVLWVIDATGQGDPITEDLTREGLAILPIVFTNVLKEQIIEKLVVSVEQVLITYPGIEILLDEMRIFQAVMTRNRNVQYMAPEGSHDDCVISLALANWGLFGGIYAPPYKEPVQPSEAEQFWARVKRDRVKYAAEHDYEGSDMMHVTEAGATDLEP